MKLSYDDHSDILYILIKKGPAYDSGELDEDIRVEYDKRGKIVGIEIQDARRNVDKVMAKEIAQLLKTIAT